MDVKISQKETMLQPKGAVEVLVDGIFDFFPVTSTDEEGQVWIEDVEYFDDFLEEEKDRVIFSVLRQKGQDPISPYEGVQWSEVLLSEIPTSLLMQQIANAAAEESAYVKTSFETIIVNGQEQLSIAFSTIGTAGVTGS